MSFAVDPSLIDGLGPTPDEDTLPDDVTPPKRKRGRPKGSTNSTTGTRAPRRKPWPKADETQRYLNGMAQLISGVVTLMDETDGEILADGLPVIASELVNLARDDVRLRQYLELSATPGKYGPLIFAVAGVAVPIMAHHGLIPQIFPVPAPAPESNVYFMAGGEQ